MGSAIGYGCAASCVALVVYAIWLSTRGNFTTGLVAVALAFVLLMCALAALRVKSRL